jgi:hypothetical protein
MQINKKREAIRTHEGGVAMRISPEQQLRRSVAACMLWEDTFYEDGVDIATRIMNTVPLVDPQIVATLAVEARTVMNLRHVPLLLCVALARTGALLKETLASVICRADELTEFLAIYWMEGKCPISAQAKKGLAMAFTKFNGYQLAKYNRDNAIKLRDVLFLCHAAPDSKEQAETWKQLVDGTLAPPDTWEVRSSSGEDKRAMWTTMLEDDTLGGMALLRNLRNMYQAGVDEILVGKALHNMSTHRILPFRFIAAAKYAPQWEHMIEEPFLRNLTGTAKMPGKTVVLVDVSGSMDWDNVSKHSDMTRLDAACGLAVCVREICDEVAVYTFSHDVVRVPDRHGFALRDAVTRSQSHGGTYLARAIERINVKEKYDRIIVITDEQSHDGNVYPNGKGYLINTASYQNGVSYGKWMRIDGFSEAVIKYIQEYETL